MFLIIYIIILIYWACFFYFLGRYHTKVQKKFRFIKRNHFPKRNKSLDRVGQSDFRGSNAYEFIYPKFAEQFYYINQCNLYAVSPVNCEAINVFNCLQNWLIKKNISWYIVFEVAMGAFIKTDSHSSQLEQDQAFRAYNSKRVDFLIVDYHGFPKLVIEYNGSGHYLSDDAEDRMKVKKFILYKAKIPLIEINEGFTRREIFKMLDIFYQNNY